MSRARLWSIQSASRKARRRSLNRRGLVCPMAQPLSSWRSTRPVRPRQRTASSRSVSVPIVFWSTRSAWRRKTLFSTRIFSPSPPALKSIMIMRLPLSRRLVAFAGNCPAATSQAGCRTSLSPSVAMSLCVGPCTLFSSSMRSVRAWIWGL